MKIAFFDSGIGGISVLHQALNVMPNEDYLYYADTDHVPYGTKTTEQIIQYVDEAIGFITQQDVKAVVVACNTATSVAIKYVRQKYPIPIIGMEPAVKPALCNGQAYQPTKRILVMATPVTLKGEKLHNLLRQWDSYHQVDLLPLPQLVSFAEDFRFDDPVVEAYLTSQLAAFSLESYCTVVLGCTHFKFFEHMIKKIFPHDIQIIDGSIGTVNYLRDILRQQNLLNQGSGQITFFTSGREIKDLATVQRYEQLLKHLNSLGNDE